MILVALVSGIFAWCLPAPAAHRAEKEITFSFIFKTFPPARIGRALSSRRTGGSSPTLVFHSRIHLNASGEAKLGKSCFVRDVTHADFAGRAYYNSVLGQSPGSKIEPGVPFEMGLISFPNDALQLQLSTKKLPIQRLEVSCSHPNIQSWSVADFEAYSGHRITVRIPRTLKELHSRSRSPSLESLTLRDLRGFRYNAAFGSGLPGTSGIQLLFGANLKAYVAESDTSLMVGRRCQMLSQKGRSFNARYLKGSKFAFLGYHPKPESRSVELVFGNWNHSPHQIRLECLGTEEEVKALSFHSIEQDLNGAIRFYRK